MSHSDLRTEPAQYGGTKRFDTNLKGSWRKETDSPDFESLFNGTNTS